MSLISVPPSRSSRASGRIASAALVLACLSAAPGRAQTTTGFADGVYRVSLDAIRKELAEANRFPATSASPSPYLADFFGIQRIQDLPPENIVRDLVPGLAQVESRSPVLKLRFAAGYTAAFYLRCMFSLDESASPDFTQLRRDHRIHARFRGPVRRIGGLSGASREERPEPRLSRAQSLRGVRAGRRGRSGL